MRNPTPFIQRMHAGGMMPIFFHPDEQVCLDLLHAAYEGGVRVIEMVNRGKEAKSIFPKIKEAADKLPGLYLGAGTIYHSHEAEEFIDMGAEFIVAPVMNPKLGDYCSKVDVPWIPGCGTVTEVFQAQELGSELVKIYPANVLGPDFVPSVHAVLPKIELIPTGGVEPTLPSMKKWFDAGVLCVGMGSQLFRKDLIAKRDFETIKTSVSEAMDIIKSLQEGKS
ncbi:bifunctional 4-hydroxy-2-oxoglutarate aldolase/2-dehydro-3-deoxy-phosphogluconate aldolase [Algoriphagus sp. H41]|uniref:Bifunctional 4-hydroxy-2-oxoglutarate aldolase/2-dehydro-3-deoxy-phosphogluconate aldolase n=1 Tax=Algoriphagus oliviformis TaxID=2811231 RepID=A0ABS3C4D2_9BACT|nr:bifunctional 4-hydroxy-2-oxoglutarate aldolase/2-dehydro-3-deoxy-phosphogluconate aldolase [Algoriphagus oliviformis]MBN7811926.1 bifunctional 4-hydroxy-2-oxoglutarate aldolase/2-dehydro-3-deoxy-phosphogluconate aldolase [Algoriphagus oliviformis]